MNPESVSSASETLRACGLLGAGGAGFPTYRKHQLSHRWFVINGADSEPGYKKDRLLLTTYPDVFDRAMELLPRVFDATVVIGIKTHHRAKWEPFLKRWPIRWVSDAYWTGEARRMVSEIVGVPVPFGHRAEEVGAVVNCVETVYNMVRALDHGFPVTHKFVQVYGGVKHPQVFKVPIGTRLVDLLAVCGLDFERTPNPTILTGGPIMGLEADLQGGCVTKVTNDVFVAPHDWWRRFVARVPTWEQSSWGLAQLLGIEQDVERAERELEQFEDLSGSILQVVLPLYQGGYMRTPPKPMVQIGQPIMEGDVVAEFQSPNAVALHASIDGYVTAVTPQAITIDRQPPRVPRTYYLVETTSDNERQAWVDWVRTWADVASLAVSDDGGRWWQRTHRQAVQEVALRLERTAPGWTEWCGVGQDEQWMNAVERVLWQTLGWDGAVPERLADRATYLQQRPPRIFVAPIGINALSLWLMPRLARITAASVETSAVVPLVGTGIFVDALKEKWEGQLCGCSLREMTYKEAAQAVARQIRAARAQSRNRQGTIDESDLDWMLLDSSWLHRIEWALETTPSSVGKVGTPAEMADTNSREGDDCGTR